MPERKRPNPKTVARVHDVAWASSVVIPGPMYALSLWAERWTNPMKGRTHITRGEASHLQLAEVVRVLGILGCAMAYLGGWQGWETGAVAGAINFGLGLYVANYYADAAVSGSE